MKEISLGNLTIRPVTRRDARPLMLAVQNPASNIKDFFGWAVDAQRWQFPQFAAFIEHYMRYPFPYEAFSIYYGKQWLGIFTCGGAYDHHGTQIAYFLDRKWQGKGVATEVVDVLTERAFKLRGWDYCEIHVDDANEASRRIPEKLGFEVLSKYACEPHGLKETGQYSVYFKLNPTPTADRSYMNYAMGVRHYTHPAWAELEKVARDMQELAMLYQATTR